MMHRKTIWLLCLATILQLSRANNTFGQIWNPNHAVGTITGKYHFTNSQTPDQLVELLPAGYNIIGISYQWEQSSMPLSGFTEIPGATAPSYTFPGSLSQTMYYRRKTSSLLGQFVYSNAIKIQMVSADWEDRNYVREHTVLTTGITTWEQVDALPIGDKLQSTTYMDNLGRPVQKIDREVATPSSGSLWGDVVQFYEYDEWGRQPVKYLPYTTITESGKFKTNPEVEQPQYYTNGYSETFPYSTITFDDNPLNQVINVKSPGTSWAVGSGNSAAYDMNSEGDDVKKFSVGYIQGNPPLFEGGYPTNSLHKITYTDENGKQVISFLDNKSRLILKKIQLDDTPPDAYSGWICTYYVYDVFGQLRYQLQPEAVKYLDANGWSFAGTNGQLILNEQCFQYHYDDKGRVIWKKSPGASPVSLLYDNRDRVVFMQDGNQAALLPTPQWTVTLYDELDRPIAYVLYNTTQSISALQADIDNATARTAITISNAANTGGGPNIILPTSFNPLTSSDLNNPSVALVLKYIFYDNYEFAEAKAFNINFTNLSAYSSSDPNVIPIATSQRTANMFTGSKTRVLGSNTFLPATAYYDEHGYLIQSLADNLKSGIDIITYQHHFDGRLLSTCSDHTTPGTGYTSFKTLTKYVFDKLGKVTSVHKQFGSNSMTEVTSYDYDDFGRLKTKHLDPGYASGANMGLESLHYSYNIHNQITGINKDYALKEPSSYNKWEHYFGMYIGYDNRDNVFSNAQLNGQVTGILWSTRGDDAQRRYNYMYDNANRLVEAAFSEQQHPGDGWSNSEMDFTVSGTNGEMTYDLNGNLINMLHKGVLPGNASPVTVDNLSYSYDLYSNRLNSVIDGMTNTAVNGKFGDFKDGVNGAGTPDYVYDANGNVVVDLNKTVESLNGGTPGTNGISYNHLNKPELIRIVGKGTIKIVYNADGEKLQRAFIPEAGGPASITTYINEFVYQESANITTTSIAPLGGTPALSQIHFEEGRIRVITPTSQDNGYDVLIINGNISLPDSKMGVFDYFITDYQQNVRMILTEEVHTAVNTATLETTRATLEETIFGQPGSANEVAVTRFPKPVGWTASNLGSSVSRLGNIAGLNIGPNTLQKVMAGDEITTTVQYYYQAATGGNNPNIPAAILSSLAQSLGNGSAATDLVKGNAAAISSQLNATSGFINAVTPSGSGGTTPQAYLTILFFDERFNFIDETDGGVVQEQVAASVTSVGDDLSLYNIKAPENGYVFVYVSNRSDQDVYFDNLAITLERSNILEENHYYSYGLKIAAISTSRTGDVNEGVLKNNYLYNAKELFDDAGLNWYDYGFRNYDPQIGRFPQLDPLTDKYPFLTPYQYASCDPIANIDVDGLEGASAIGGVASTVGDFTYQIASGSRFFMPALQSVNTSATIAKTFGTIANVTSIIIKTSLTAANIINGNITTSQVGGDPYRKGVTDAVINANTFGVTDLWNNLWGDDPLDEYDDIDDKLSYLKGRIAGDAIALAQAGIENTISNGVIASGAQSGVGVLHGAVAGVAIKGHALAIGTVATADAAWASAELIKLQNVLKATSNRPNSSPKNGETPSTIYGKSAHRNYNPGSGYTVNRSQTVLENGWFPDAIDFVNKIVRELKPNNTAATNKGWKQVKKYAEQLKKELGGDWKMVVDTYDKNPDGTFKYNYGIPKLLSGN